MTQVHLPPHMSDSQPPPAPESSGASPAKKITKVRRISNPHLKKARKMVQAKVSPHAAAETPEPDAKESAEAVGEFLFTAPPETPELSETAEQSEQSDQSDQSEQSEQSETSEHEWPEPEPASSGRQEGQESSKRKRRRKKNKNNQHQAQLQTPASDDSDSPQIATIIESAEPQPKPFPLPPQPPRPRQDPEVVAKYAWKIYLAEVSEEGVALIGDHDAKDLARRCFRLAEIFLEEQSRRR